MRYHLHEVLDIGDRYDWKVLSWEVREIEKPGSWHTTVGLLIRSYAVCLAHFDV